MTKIEWTRGDDGSAGMSWNALRAVRIETGKSAHHCEHVNEACRFCYAERMNARLGCLPFKPGHRKEYRFEVDQTKLLAPLRRKKPTRIFVESMSDAFGGWWSDEQRDQIYAVVALCPQHTFINLSKRPAKRREYLSDALRHNAIELAAEGVRRGPEQFGGKHVLAKLPLANVIEGVSVSCQAEADEFVPILLDTPAACRAVSAEPLLGPIDFTGITYNRTYGTGLLNALTGERRGHVPNCPLGNGCRLDWIIVGGESGPQARPMHPQWARDIRDQCQAAGVAFHFKQHGEWIGAPDLRRLPGGSGPGFGEFDHCRHDQEHDAVRVGKKSAGRLLDNRSHDGFPVMGDGTR